MNENEFQKMKNELKQEFKKLYNEKKLDKIIDILDKYHPLGKVAQTNAQILILCEFIQSNTAREEFVPICTLSTAEDQDGKYAGSIFGIIPEGAMRLH